MENKHIELVKKWLADNDSNFYIIRDNNSVSQEELTINARAAWADARAAWADADATTWDDSDATARAAARAAEAAACAAACAAANSACAAANSAVSPTARGEDDANYANHLVEKYEELTHGK